MVNINIIGRLGADAEVKTSQKGTQFVQFRMGVDDYANGKADTVWFSVISSTEQAIRIAKYLTKGKAVCVHGTESLRLFTNKLGEQAIGRDVMAYSIDFVSVGQRKDDTATTTDTAQTTTQSQPQITIPNSTTAPAQATSASSTFDDDLPF